MSREEHELGEQSFYESLLGKGKGDPDIYGYPGQADEAPLNIGLELIRW